MQAPVAVALDVLDEYHIKEFAQDERTYPYGIYCMETLKMHAPIVFGALKNVKKL